MKITARCILAILSLGLAGPTLAAAATAYFPTTIGSAWTYNTQSLTLSQSQLVMKSGTETVEVQADGRFRSFLNLENSNTVESYTSYSEQGQALLISGTQITLVTKDMPLPGFWTETTTVNSYSPYLPVFPSAVDPDTHETSTSTQTMYLTGMNHTPFGDYPMQPVTSTSQHAIDITVGAVESVTVPAGTFSALKIVTTDTVTEGGQTGSPISISQWYAPGVGLVKMTSPVQNRELVSYSISSGSTRQLTVTMSGDGMGSVNSDPSGIACPGICSASFAHGTSVTLIPSPSGGSVFSSWTGDCSGTGNCVTVLDANLSANAVFSYVRPVKMGGMMYSTVGAAYSAAADGSIIQLMSWGSLDAPDLNRDIRVTLKGGYDSFYLNNTGTSVLQGVFTVGRGGVTVENIAVR